MQSTEFTYDHPSGLRITRHLGEPEVASLAGVSRRDMGTGYVWYLIPIATSASDKIQVSLCFHSGTLDSVSLAVNDADLGSSWSEWSEEKERMRANRTQDWLKAQGYATGTYTWGVIWAGCDPKTCDGSAVIRYNSEHGGGGNSAALRASP